eukprot:TRINITY_DN8241_c0_g1_i2.p3 TRINITY_DN8241_c0_g1~~TRINITY_DN8241_c0_g1_i2.p3  ORF type:complete len:125 (-),score=26.95 TRINITY_DN8241_c0_g1_i2:3-377(-)
MTRLKEFKSFFKYQTEVDRLVFFIKFNFFFCLNVSFNLTQWLNAKLSLSKIPIGASKCTKFNLTQTGSQLNSCYASMDWSILKLIYLTFSDKSIAVSYTHLTLPTIYSVQISVVAVSLKKKNKQ